MLKNIFANKRNFKKLPKYWRDYLKKSQDRLILVYYKGEYGWIVEQSSANQLVNTNIYDDYGNILCQYTKHPQSHNSHEISYNDLVLVRKFERFSKCVLPHLPVCLSALEIQNPDSFLDTV